MIVRIKDISELLVARRIQDSSDWNENFEKVKVVVEKVFQRFEIIGWPGEIDWRLRVRKDNLIRIAVSGLAELEGTVWKIVVFVYERFTTWLIKIELSRIRGVLRIYFGGRILSRNFAKAFNDMSCLYDANAKPVGG